MSDTTQGITCTKWVKLSSLTQSKFIPLRIPKDYGQEVVTSAICVSDILPDVFANTIMTQDFLSAGTISMSDPDTGLDFAQKCAKYLGLDEDEVDRLKVLIIKDEEEKDA